MGFMFSCFGCCANPVQETARTAERHVSGPGPREGVGGVSVAIEGCTRDGGGAEILRRIGSPHLLAMDAGRAEDAARGVPEGSTPAPASSQAAWACASPFLHPTVQHPGLGQRAEPSQQDRVRRPRACVPGHPLAGARRPPEHGPLDDQRACGGRRPIACQIGRASRSPSGRREAGARAHCTCTCLPRAVVHIGIAPLTSLQERLCCTDPFTWLLSHEDSTAGAGEPRGRPIFQELHDSMVPAPCKLALHTQSIPACNCI